MDHQSSVDPLKYNKRKPHNPIKSQLFLGSMSFKFPSPQRLCIYVATSEVNDMVAIAVWWTEELHSTSIYIPYS